MSTTALQILPNPLSFNAALGSYQDQSIIITNNGAWTLSSIVFQYGTKFALESVQMSSDGGTTWTNQTVPVSTSQGYLLKITVRYTPVATPNFGLPDTDIMTLTVDAPLPGTQMQVPLYGMGLSSGIQHTLPTAHNMAPGDMTSYVIVDPSLPALTVPATVRLISVGKPKEQLDAQAGTLEVESLDAELAEDYSTYPEGFWYKVANEYASKPLELMLGIMEGANETFLFRGRLFPQNANWEENYLSPVIGVPVDWVRGVKLQLVSGLNLLKEVSMGALLAELRAHFVSATATVYGAQTVQGQFVTFASIIASMLKLAFNGTYDETTVTDNSADFLPKDGSGNTYSFLQCGVMAQFNQGNGWVDTAFFNLLDANAWINRFATAFDLLSYISFSFGVIPKFSYDDGTGLISSTPANNKPRIEFDARGHHGGTAGFVTMSGGVTRSKSASASPLQPRAIRITDSFGIPTDLTTMGQAGFAPSSTFSNNGILLAGDPPSGMSFDIDRTIDFVILPDIIAGTYWAVVPFGNPTGSTQWRNTYWWGTRRVYTNIVASGNVTTIEAMSLYDYVAGAYATPSAPSQASFMNLFLWYLNYYLMKRFRQGRMEFTRTYGSLQSSNGTTTSHRNTKTLMGTQIHDGVQLRNFYATSVEKDIQNDRATVVWVEE